MKKFSKVLLLTVLAVALFVPLIGHGAEVLSYFYEARIVNKLTILSNGTLDVESGATIDLSNDPLTTADIGLSTVSIVVNAGAVSNVSGNSATRAGGTILGFYPSAMVKGLINSVSMDAFGNITAIANIANPVDYTVKVVVLNP